MLKLIGTFFILFSLIACDMSKNATKTTQKTRQDPDKFIISGQVIENDFIKKNGESAGYTELYFRASIQDYFIKFCESSVTKKELEPYIDQSVTVHAEIRDGNWDICPGDPAELQSRTGPYMVVKELK